MPRESDVSGRSVERASNKNYAADVNYSMQYTRWFLTLLGIWPDVVSNSTRFEKLVSRCLMPFPSLVITLLVIPIVTIPIVRDLTPRQFIILLAPLSFRISSVIKNVILVSRRRAMKLCVEHMETDWRRIENDQDREIMTNHLRVGRNLTIMCASCLYTSAIFYNILPFVSPRKINAFNETIRPVTVPGIDIYVDLRAGRNYEIVIFTSFISAFYTSTITTAICNLAAVLVCHACGQIHIVMSRLESLIDKDDHENTDRATFHRRTSFIIGIHVRVLSGILSFDGSFLFFVSLRFASKIDDFLQELCFTEVVDATLIICLVAYMVVTERKSTNIMALISYTTLLVSLSFNIFIFCQIGELLKMKCEAVGKAAYMTEWYRLPGKSGRTLVMFITMAHHPRRLTAGRVIELSISTFGVIMKTSFSYLNMLRTMTK